MYCHAVLGTGTNTTARFIPQILSARAARASKRDYLGEGLGMTEFSILPACSGFCSPSVSLALADGWTLERPHRGTCYKIFYVI